MTSEGRGAYFLLGPFITVYLDHTIFKYNTVYCFEYALSLYETLGVIN